MEPLEENNDVKPYANVEVEYSLQEIEDILSMSHCVFFMTYLSNCIINSITDRPDYQKIYESAPIKPRGGEVYIYHHNLKCKLLILEQFLRNTRYNLMH